MISRDANYLNAKLKELKKSVLDRNQVIENQKQPNSQQYSQHQTYKKDPQFKYDNIRKSAPYIDRTKQPIQQNRQNAPIYTFGQNNFQKQSYQPKVQQQWGQQTQYGQTPDVTVKRKTDSYMPIKTKQTYQPYKDQNRYSYRTENKFGAKSVDIQTPRQYQSKIKQTYNNDFVKPDLINSIEKSFLDKHSGNLIQDLNGRLMEEGKNNSQLAKDINQLTTSLESEKRNLFELENMCKNEVKLIKEKEQSTRQVWENLEKENQDTDLNFREQDTRSFELKTDLDKILRENGVLKNEMKRLVELAGEKILDLENNINSLGRMKEFENDNFTMEKEKFTNSSQFVIEQMKAQFSERSQQIEQSMMKDRQEKDVVDQQLRALAEELRAFNVNADHKIKSLMNGIVNEEQSRQNKEVKMIEDKIRIEEDEISLMIKQNQNQMQQIQNAEREGKTNLIQKNNENIRLKEELATVEQSYNKYLLNLSNMEEENAKKRMLLEQLQEENEQIIQKTAVLDQNYQDEVEVIQQQNEQNILELRELEVQLQEDEKMMTGEIQQQQEAIGELKRNHEQMIESFQNKLNNTLNKFDNPKTSYKY